MTIFVPKIIIIRLLVGVIGTYHRDPSVFETSCSICVKKVFFLNAAFDAHETQMYNVEWSKYLFHSLLIIKNCYRV